MKKSEITKLLALDAAFDQRTTGEADVEAWHTAAEIGHWNYPTARRIIIEYYSRDAGKPRLTPAAINDRLRGLRNQAAESFEAPRIPPNLPDRDYPTWYRTQLAAHCDTQLDRWATSGEEPSRALPTPPPAAVVRSLEELAARAPTHHRPAIAAAAATIRDRHLPGDPT